MGPLQCDWCLSKKRLGHRHMPTEDHMKTQGGDKPRKLPSEEPNLLANWFGTPRSQNYEKIHFCFWSHPVCGTLLWQPKQANTVVFILLHLSVICQILPMEKTSFQALPALCACVQNSFIVGGQSLQRKLQEFLLEARAAEKLREEIIALMNETWGDLGRAWIVSTTGLWMQPREIDS